MRLFQNFGLYPTYHQRLIGLARAEPSFDSYKNTLLRDRFGACHLLLPVDRGENTAFFTSGDHVPLQARWARENGMPPASQPEEILLAQIEHHRSDVFYNLDPMRYGSNFVRKLPGCVKHCIAWRAAPSPRADFSGYSLVVCNFPSILKSYQDHGWQSAYFSPSYDPSMDSYAANTDRPIDVLFVGGYSRHHRRRAEVLEKVAAKRNDLNIVFHLDRSRLTRFAESPVGRLLPLESQRRPKDICAVTADPVFGLDLYSALSKAKIVLNGAVDMAGVDRGNMRCFEAIGCGALMISDDGNYPKGMVNEKTIYTYGSADEALRKIRLLLEQPIQREHVAQQGLKLLQRNYSKNEQWDKFVKLCSEIS
jgi:hypothetical protein